MTLCRILFMRSIWRNIYLNIFFWKITLIYWTALVYIYIYIYSKREREGGKKKSKREKGEEREKDMWVCTNVCVCVQIVPDFLSSGLSHFNGVRKSILGFNNEKRQVIIQRRVRSPSFRPNVESNVKRSNAKCSITFLCWYQKEISAMLAPAEWRVWVNALKPQFEQEGRKQNPVLIYDQYKVYLWAYRFILQAVPFYFYFCLSR